MYNNCDDCQSKDYQIENTNVSFSTGAEHEEHIGPDDYEQLVSQKNTQVDVQYNTEEETNTTVSYGMHGPEEEAEDSDLAKKFDVLNNPEKQESNNDFSFTAEQNQADRDLEAMMNNRDAEYDELKPSNFD
jgi:hypothetical protein